MLKSDSDAEENDLHGEGLTARARADLKGAREADDDDGDGEDDGGNRAKIGVWNRVASGDRGSVELLSLRPKKQMREER